MKTNSRAILTLLLALVLAIPAAAAPAPEPPAEAQPYELLAELEVVRLDNGMTFLLYPTRRAPIVSGVIRYDVGGKDEKPGQTGIAHMFEHMAFKGSSRIGTRDYAAEREVLDRLEAEALRLNELRRRLDRPDHDREQLEAELAATLQRLAELQAEAGQYVVSNEFDEIYNREGGTGMNAMTSADATTYFISLPANRLELWARMESERLLDPVMREFYSERSVVQEERRMRRDNSPVSQLWDLTLAVAFQASPYAYPVIGWEDDIARLTATEAREFYRTHYTPDRAVGVIVGDIDVDQTAQLLRDTFGRIPPRPDDLILPRIPSEPPQNGLRRAQLALDAQPTLLMGWHKPSAPHPDDLRAELLMQVVSGGRSARWFEKLVKQQRLAADVSAFSGPGEALDNLFMIYATPAGDTTLDQLEAAILAEVAQLAAEPVTEAEIERARKMLRADAIRGLETNMGMALQLASAAQIGGDPFYLEERLRQLERVTPAELQQFAAQYLVERNLTIARIAPPAAEQASLQP